jgi:predicted Zn-dependent protease
MRRLTTLVIAVVMLIAAGTTFAQVRGKGRLQGIVTDKASAKPVDGATVTISPADGATAPIIVKTNAKGRWSALGLTSGSWNIDIEAKGFTTSRGAVAVSELQMMPPIATQLDPAVAKEEAAATVSAGPSVPQEVIDAVNLGQSLMAEEKFKEAVVEFEKALPALPDNLPLKQVASQAYYKSGDLKNAIKMLEEVTAADPANHVMSVLLTNLYLEDGQLDAGKARLAGLPADAITDPTVYLNIGILFLNKNNPEEAATYFTKAVDMDNTRPEAFYYRGLANLQVKKTKEAKADFEKVVALAPESTEASDAKQLINSLQ